MSGAEGVRRGMAVYGADEQLLGIVDDVEAGGLLVGGRQIPGNVVRRVDGDRVYLTDAALWFNSQGAELGDDVNQAPDPAADDDAGAGVKLTTTPKT